MRHDCMNIGILLLLSSITFYCKDSGTNTIESSQYKIVFAATDGYVYTFKLDEGKSEKFYNVSGFSPSYTPDGKKIVCYWWDYNSHEQWLVAFSEDNGTMEKIVFNKGLDEYGIDTYCWSRDRRFIAFNRTKGSFIESNIFLADVYTKEIKQLTTSSYCFAPKFSPDGTQLFFKVLQDSLIRGYLVNIDGTNMRPVTFQTDTLVGDLDWSPDGQRIVYLRISKGHNISDLFMKNIGDGIIRRLTSDGKASQGYWSPTGNQILFASRLGEGGGKADLYVIHPDGSEPKRLTDHGKVLGPPFHWSSDGKKILYAIDHGEGRGLSLRVINSNGSADEDTGVPLRWGFAWKPF